MKYFHCSLETKRCKCNEPVMVEVTGELRHINLKQKFVKETFCKTVSSKGQNAPGLLISRFTLADYSTGRTGELNGLRITSKAEILSSNCLEICSHLGFWYQRTA
jgi:hypothetical protein